MLAFGLCIVEESLVRFAGESDEEEAIPFFIAADRGYVGGLFAERGSYGLAHFHLQWIEIFVAFANGQCLTDLCDVEAFVSEELDVSDAITGEGRRDAKENQNEAVSFWGAAHIRKDNVRKRA